MEEVGIRLNLAGRRELAAGLQEGEQGFADLGEAAADAGKKAESSGRRFDRTRSILGSVGRGLMFGVKAAGALTVAAGAVGIKTAASMQTAKIGFTTMLGSAQRASKFLRGLATFAADTPFEFPELQTAASKLISAGIETNKIIPIMTTLGDVTAGVGTGSEGIDRATRAIQQMSAAGRISAEDLNQLSDAGIPVYDLLSSALGKTKAEVAALKDEGKLGGAELAKMMRALETGKGLERFNGLMEKQSTTLAGRWSTLKDTVTQGLAGAIKPAMPLLVDLLGLADRLARGALPRIQDGVRGMAGGVADFVKVWKQGGFKGALDSLSAPGAPTGAAGIAGGLAGIGIAIRDVDWGAVKDGLGEGSADTVSVFGVAIGFAADHVDTLARYMPLLIGAFVAYKGAQALANIAAIAALPVTIANIGANIALSASNRSLATQMAITNNVEKVGIITRARGTVATIASTVASKVAAGATKVWAAGQWLLNAALTANPIGLVVAGIALLVGGLVLAYKKSETFRGIVDALWNGVLKPFGAWIGGVLLKYVTTLAQGWLMMGRFGVMAFRFLLTAAFSAFDGILSAAEAGLGWIKGMGDKIRGAREAFNQFGDSTINKLQNVENKLRSTQAAVDGLAKDRSSTITIGTVYTTRSSGKEASMGDFGIPGRAKGGPVLAGRPYIVGEHRPELFVPRVNGRILPEIPDSSVKDGPLYASPEVRPQLFAPRVNGRILPDVTDGPLEARPRYAAAEVRPEPLVPRVDGRILPRVPDSPADLADIDPHAFDGTSMGGGRPRQPLHIHLDVDGRQITEVVVDDINDVQARK